MFVFARESFLNCFALVDFPLRSKIAIEHRSDQFGLGQIGQSFGISPGCSGHSAGSSIGTIIRLRSVDRTLPPRPASSLRAANTADGGNDPVHTLARNASTRKRSRSEVL